MKSAIKIDSYLLQFVGLLALIVGALATFKFKVSSDLTVNISLFEPLLLLSCLLTFSVSGPTLLSSGRKTMLVFLILFVGTLVQTYLVIPESQDLFRHWLKGGMRSLFILVNLFGLWLLFSIRPPQIGPKTDLALYRPLALVSVLYMAAGISVILSSDGYYLARTVFSSNLLFLYLLHKLFENKPRLLLDLALLSIIAVLSLLALSKIGAVVAILLMAHRLAELFQPKLIRAAVFVGLPSASLLIASVVLPKLSVLGRTIDGLSRSMVVRFDLWSASLASLPDSLAFGIGGGLFHSFLESVGSPLASENHRYIHSLPLSLVIEHGLIGCGMLAVFVFLTIRCARNMQQRGLLAPFLIVILPLALMHDIQSNRLFLLLLTLGAYGMHRLSQPPR